MNPKPRIKQLRMFKMLLQLCQVNSSSYAIQPTDGPFHPLQ
jgi:hypothetical protein